MGAGGYPAPRSAAHAMRMDAGHPLSSGAMPESQPKDDEAEAPAGATSEDLSSEEEAEAVAAPSKTPEELQAEVEARRAATSARLDRSKGVPGRATSDDPTGASARRAARSAAVPKPSKRTGGLDAKAARTAAARSGNPKKAAAAAEATRYTAPIPRSQLESPAWVGALMFGLLGVGMVVIFLTYVVWGGRPLTLGVGLAFILGGILTATQLR